MFVHLKQLNTFQCDNTLVIKSESDKKYVYVEVNYKYILRILYHSHFQAEYQQTVELTVGIHVCLQTQSGKCVIGRCPV